MRVLVVDDSATIRRIVSAILTEAGYSIVASPDGADALDRVQREGFDLVLVDFVMPRLNGFQFAQAVRSIQALRELPIVLMSARAELIADRFLATTGAAAWLTKPFTPTALLDAIESALSASARVSLRSSAEADASSVRASVSPLPLVSRRGSGTYRGVAQPGEVLARALQPALLRLGVQVSHEALSGALQTELQGRVTDELHAAIDALSGARAALEGRLEQVSLGEVLQLLVLQKQTGVLRVESGGARSRSVALGLRRGRIDGCVASGFDERFRLGEFLAVEGVSRESLERADAMAPAAGELFGELLQREAIAPPLAVAAALERQSRELVYECLAWSEGRFRFEAAASLVPAQRARLGLAAEALAMEAMRRKDEWRMIRELIPSDESVLARTSLAAGASDDEARAVLAAIDGVRSVRALSRALAMRPFELCGVLCRLLRERALSVAA